jgi:predicted nuclease with TOPRIM domain
MKKGNYIHKSEYFCGNKVSDYGIEHGYVDYRTLAQAFDAVMANNIIEKTEGVIGYWDLENGYIDNSEEIDELNDRINELMLDNENGEHDDEIDELQNECADLRRENEMLKLKIA